MAEPSFARTDPRRHSSVLQTPRQPLREEDADTATNTAKVKTNWPKRPHTEPQLHDLVTEVKYEIALGFNGNKRLFKSKITHFKGVAVMDSPTFNDMMWRFETGEPNSFSNSEYEAMNDFENHLFSEVSKLVKEEFQTKNQGELKRMTSIILKLLRVAPAGPINVNKILDPTFDDTDQESFIRCSIRTCLDSPVKM